MSSQSTLHPTHLKTKTPKRRDAISTDPTVDDNDEGSRSPSIQEHEVQSGKVGTKTRLRAKHLKANVEIL